jgi:hypothetical protein
MDHLRVTRLGEFSPFWRWFIWGSVMKITEEAHIFVAPLSTVHTSYVLFLQITDWATFWATFSETRLITLIHLIAACNSDKDLSRKGCSSTGSPVD